MKHPTLGGFRLKNARTAAIVAISLAVGLTGFTSARADICNEYRTSIDAFITESAGIIALNDTVEAARNGIRAAHATRAALRILETESSMKILEAAGAPASDQLEAADTASTAAIETFEAIYKRLKGITDELSSTGAAELDAARIAADAAADPALDALGTLESVSRRGALKATSASVSAAPGKTTSTALISVHESIYRAVCE